MDGEAESSRVWVSIDIELLQRYIEQVRSVQYVVVQNLI